MDDTYEMFKSFGYYVGYSSVSINVNEKINYRMQLYSTNDEMKVDAFTYYFPVERLVITS